MYSCPDLEPVCCSMSSSNCCFLICIQISQEAGKVAWYSILLKNFPQFVVIHTVKGFGVVNKAEVNYFPQLSWFFNDPMDVGNLTSGYSAFSKSSLYIWNFMVHILLKPGLENFDHYFANVWDECNCAVVWTLFGIAFFGVTDILYIKKKPEHLQISWSERAHDGSQPWSKAIWQWNTELRRRLKMRLNHSPSHGPYVFSHSTLEFFFFFFLSEYIVDSQCCVSFCCTLKWISYTYTFVHSFLVLFPYRSLQSIE